MKFSTPLIFGALTALVTAAPTPETDLTIDGTLVPSEAILGGLSIPDDVYPVFNYENNTATVVFLNATILADAKASNAEAKRDLTSIEEEFSKRDAEADPWHWVALKIGQPFFKRDAEAEADAWHWVALKIGQPFFKRSADPWHWVALKIGQPFFKRDAEASADPWHWVALKIGQPFF
ncbi:hypothetical protein METBIDRAFT_9958 [Metschnikowia bicuspidata var. bicuspidata NRRL YB-4993]|uniref:Mating factor alpha precursor N-terminal domain-containing protein n=1 Tax=Metschnikowia bicuspidata var. bicuspidata NRRL YB-4993 TaxID=869754 RepID=A0A1A0HI88_9ASCO|nr:hypothetical protein METBIDRAFT_9958 [Metschnikowia bicuspidata var. bicuspidata NRRL YB-4993]OBA23720.1 hypothetical protein METBIDRAFT_9958 [Metschnikowia bicuspidata var. bicuspidata NRRL YB-4993]